jgi:CubicO group peptidase (beta-lactamase class C family)
VAGAVVAVVHAGEIALLKGYGLADVAAGRPVDPRRTLFRPGSISKLFTWTAVMQLVEQGKLDLDADVNDYLQGVSVPPAFDAPVTLAHLMTHTPGFEDRMFGLFSASAERMTPLAELLAHELPTRVMPPGDAVAYSNYGTALAGLVVEQVSGLPFERYIEQHILKPLDMRRTTFDQPLPPSLAADMSGGYFQRDGRFEAGPFEYVRPSPAGGISGTAEDMAQFMIAHLQDGRFRPDGQGEDRRILRAETAQRMHTRLHSHDPRLNGFAHGFMELDRNGQRVIGHGGDTIFFHSALALLPEQDIGVFVSYNSQDAGISAFLLLQLFIDHYFPGRPETRVTPTASGSPEGLARFAGIYGGTRKPHTTPDKVMGLAFVLGVRPAPDGGALLMADPLFGESRWLQRGPLLFERADEPGLRVFQEDAAGNVYRVADGTFPIMAFDRLGAFSTPNFQLAVPVLCLLTLISGLFVWPIGAVRRWRSAAPRRTGRARARRGLALATSLGFVSFVGLLGVTMSDPLEAIFGPPASFTTLLWFALAVAALTPIQLIAAFTAWRDATETTGARLHYSASALAAAGFALWLQHWNLLGA